MKSNSIKNEPKPRLFELWDQIIGNRDHENKGKEEMKK